jgi:putative membrane protein insertion efficiency factor
MTHTHPHDQEKDADRETDVLERVPAPSIPAIPVLALLRFYKKRISPAFPPACRFQPTCSEYAHDAVAKYGVVKGGRLAIWRILRCNPWGGCGWDPVT